MTVEEVLIIIKSKCEYYKIICEYEKALVLNSLGSEILEKIIKELKETT